MQILFMLCLSALNLSLNEAQSVSLRAGLSSGRGQLVSRYLKVGLRRERSEGATQKRETAGARGQRLSESVCEAV